MRNSSCSSSPDEESPSDYVPGGYHPVQIGDCYSSHLILSKLGWGHFSTVWLAKVSKGSSCTVRALKIVKSAPHYTETANDEILLLQKVNTASQSHHKNYVVKLFDSFKINGPHGSHVAMSFEVLGPNLLDLIKKYEHKGIPVNAVKAISKQVLMGLEYLHTDCGIIHTDLKPENILIVIDVDEELKKMGLYDAVYNGGEIPGLVKIKAPISDKEEFNRYGNCWMAVTGKLLFSIPKSDLIFET